MRVMQSGFNFFKRSSLILLLLFIHSFLFLMNDRLFVFGGWNPHLKEKKIRRYVFQRNINKFDKNSFDTIINIIQRFNFL